MGHEGQWKGGDVCVGMTRVEQIIIVVYIPLYDVFKAYLFVNILSYFLRTMNLTEDEGNSYEVVMKKFDDYFKPKRNELRLRREFQSRKQLPGEDLEAYLRELYKMAENCNFTDKLDRIRDQFVYGLSDQDMIEKLEMLYMTAKDEKFDIGIVMEYCRSYRDTRQGRAERDEPDAVNRVEQRGFKQNNGNSGQNFRTSGRATGYQQS